MLDAGGRRYLYCCGKLEEVFENIGSREAVLHWMPYAVPRGSRDHKLLQTLFRVFAFILEEQAMLCRTLPSSFLLKRGCTTEPSALSIHAKMLEWLCKFLLR